MAGKSPIEWTEQTWNPIVGCSIVSPGCTNCYAMRQAWRFKEVYIGRQVAGPPAENVVRSVKGKPIWTGQLALAPDSTLLAPLKRKKPTMYFVNSMSDLFHENVPDEWIDKVFAVMALSPQHTFQVLTKRAARMRDYAAEAQTYGTHGWLDMPATWPLPNVWLGVSTERQQEADERIPLLLQTPAAVRFISAEPLLGPLDIVRYLMTGWHNSDADWNPRAAAIALHLDWVIVGGESGKDARPMHPDWVRSLHHQCDAAGTKFFFKQWGEWSDYVDAINVSRNHALCGLMGRAPALENDWPKALQFLNSTKGIDGAGVVSRVGKKAAGRHLDGVLHDAMPQADGRGRG